MSSARVVRCWVKSRNERNPCSRLPAYLVGTPGRLPQPMRRKAGTTSNHHAPYGLGYTRATMVRDRGQRTSDSKRIPKNWPQFGLQAATRLHEAGVASNRGSACRGECVPGSCTHRPSHHESGGHPKSGSQPFRSVLPKVNLIIGVKS